MIKQPFLPLCGFHEVNGQHSSAGFQNPSDFVSTLLARFAAQVMKHDRGQYRIELTVGKGQRFDDAIPKNNFGASLVGLPTRPGKHLGRRINPTDSACWANALLGGNGKCASAAADVQDRLAGFYVCQIECFCSVNSLSPQGHQPEEEVIKKSAVEDYSRGTRRCVLLFHI